MWRTSLALWMVLAFVAPGCGSPSPGPVGKQASAQPAHVGGESATGGTSQAENRPSARPAQGETVAQQSQTGDESPDSPKRPESGSAGGKRSPGEATGGPPGAPPSGRPRGWQVAAQYDAARTLWPGGKEPPRGDLRTRPQGVDWPDFLGPNRDNKSPETGLPTRWPEEGPPLVWSCTLGAGYPAPSVSRGRIYVFSQYGTTVRLSCRRSETGQELWRFEYPSHYQDLYGYDNGPRCTPVVDGQRVYILGAEGMLHCLDAETGKLHWRLDTVKRFGVVQNFFGVGSTPVVEGELLLVQVGGSPPEDQRVPPGQLDLVHPNGTALVALDKQTGKVRWAVGDELASYASPLVRTIGGKRRCLLFARGGLLGVTLPEGSVWFHFPWRAPILESVNAATPVVVGAEVFLSETYGPGSVLLSLEGKEPRVVWSDAKRPRDKAMQCHWATPIYHQGYLYGCSGRHTATADLRCVEWKTGRVMWRQENTTRCSLLYVDGHLVVLGEYGDLMLLRATPERFELVRHWRLADPEEPQRPLLRYPAWAAPVLSHGLLYLRGEGRLVCLELIPEKSSPKKQAVPSQQ